MLIMLSASFITWQTTSRQKVQYLLQRKVTISCKRYSINAVKALKYRIYALLA